MSKLESLFFEHSIKEIHALFRTGALCPRKVAEFCIARIQKLDSRYHAWAHFDSEKLRRSADECEQRCRSSHAFLPLDGIPVGVKDVFNTIDFPTEMGSEIWAGFTPGNDARVVYYLKNAGGLIAGKTVTAEFAVHALNDTLNPHEPLVTPGTSSSGSAVAVSLGMVPLSLGTQTGASIIRPASFCGVYGYKPSFGLVPRTGSLKTTDSLDTIGFFVSKPADIRPVFDVVRVHGPNFPFSNAILNDELRQGKPRGTPWKVGVVRTHTWNETPQYAKNALMEFVEELGRHNEIILTDLELPSEFERVHAIHERIYNKCLAYYFSGEFRQNGKMSSVMSEMIRQGNSITSDSFHESISLQNKYIRMMDNIMSSYDVCICLATSGQAPLRGQAELKDPSLMWTLMHLPALSAPVFRSPAGLPFGLQIIARKYNDYLLMHFVESLTNLSLLPNRPAQLYVTQEDQ